jgi:hypothetical protein
VLGPVLAGSGDPTPSGCPTGAPRRRAWGFLPAAPAWADTSPRRGWPWFPASGLSGGNATRPPAARRCRVHRRSSRPGRAPRTGSLAQTPVPTRSLHLRWMGACLARACGAVTGVPGTARLYRCLGPASPARWQRQCPSCGQAAFPAHPANCSSPSAPDVRPFPARDGGGYYTCTHRRCGVASADPCRLNRVSQRGLPLVWPGGRSPQIRALTFPAPWPDLPLCPLMAWTSWFLAHSSGRTASYRVRVPPGAVLPPASFGPHLAVTPLPLASG